MQPGRTILAFAAASLVVLASVVPAVPASAAPTAPDLVPKTMYGMPGFANADGKIVVFFQPAKKFKTRYATIGFDDTAKLDDGDFWSVGFAVLNWTPEVEAKVTELVRRAVS